MATAVEQVGTTEVAETYTPPEGPEGTASAPITVRADLTNEYVASAEGFAWAWVSQERWLRSLPNPIDDVSRDYGSRIYDVDMPHEPQVYSTLRILVMAVLAEGLETMEPVEPEDPDYARSMRIRAFCNYCLDHLKRPTMMVLSELIEGMLKLGHKVAEQIYELRTLDPEVGEQILLTDLKSKPHEATAFVVDAFNNFIGVFYLQPNQALPWMGASVEDGKTIEDKMVPRAKFMIPTNNPKDGDPRGTSHIRAAYGPWWKKQQLIPAQMQFMARFAQGILYETLPPNTASPNAVDNTGALKKNTLELNKLRAGGTKSAFNGSALTLIESQHEGGVYINAQAQANTEIAKAILFQTLTTEEGKHMARAASQTHQDVFGILIAFLRNIMEWTIRNEILAPLVFYNFGEDSMHLVPTVSLGDTAAQDQAVMMTAVAKLQASGYIAEDQFAAIDEMLGIPVRDAEAWANELTEKKQAAADATKAMQANGQDKANQQDDNSDNEDDGDSQDSSGDGASSKDDTQE